MLLLQRANLERGMKSTAKELRLDSGWPSLWPVASDLMTRRKSEGWTASDRLKKTTYNDKVGQNL